MHLPADSEIVFLPSMIRLAPDAELAADLADLAERLPTPLRTMGGAP